MCPDGNFWAGVDSSACPAYLTGASGGSSISDTTANISVTSTTTSGTLYAGVKPTVTPDVCPAAPTRAEFIAGTGAGGYIGSSDATPAVGLNEIAITGLTADDQYCSYHLQIDDQGRPSANNAEFTSYIATSDPWSTLPGAPDPGAAPDLETFNARFIGTGGSNSNDGLTHATRWLNTVPATSLPTGTDVYFLKGTDNGERVVTINWSGTADDKVIIGCYYMDPANSNQATSCDEGSETIHWRVAEEKAQLPIIQGSYNYESPSCMDNNSCTVPGGGSIPPNVQSPLLNLNGRAYLTIQDLAVRQSAGRCIETSDATGALGHVTLQRLAIEYCREQGILLNNLRENSRPVIRDVLGHAFNMNRNGPGIGVQGVKKPTVYALVENNVFRYLGGEGLNLLKATNGIYRNNVISDCRKFCLYLDNAADVVVENNLIYGDGIGSATPGSDTGIVVQVEGTNYSINDMINSTGNVIRNNIIGNVAGGLRVIVSEDVPLNQTQTVRQLGYKSGALLLGNTTSQVLADFLWVNTGSLVNSDVITHHNNLHVTGGTRDCATNLNLGVDAGTAASHNAYDEPVANMNANCRGTTGNVQVSAPAVDTTSSTPVAIDLDDYRLAAGSAAVNAGVVQATPILDTADYPQYGDLTGDCVLADADWEKPLHVDYECTVRGASVTIGALETTTP